MMSKKTSIVPFGWKRIIEVSSSSTRSVTYVSPNGAVLSSIVEVCQYLEKDDTCKCGLQCPIHVPKVFSFNPEVQSINLTQKEWCQQENKTESHRKNCQHWNKLQKTQIGKKKAPCHSELTIEPPPKLIIIRKDGQLRSVIPDKGKASAGAKKSAGKDAKLPPSPSSATSAASRKSSTTSLKSPLFEPGVSTTASGMTRAAGKSKSDFKLQWIKADDELSHNDGESGNELCFSPDLKKSPPMSFPQSLIPGLSSPLSLFKQEGQFAMPNMVNQRALFMQGGSNAGLTSLHGGIEPVHRFGMSAFPGSNFVLKSETSSAGVAQNSFSPEIQRHPLMAVKSEQGQQFNQPSHFGFPTSVAQSQSKRFVQPGTMQDPHGGMMWQQNQNIQLAGNLKQMSSNISGMRPRAQLKSPTRQPGPQQFALGSPTMLNPTSPYGFQMGNSGQGAPLMSPGQATDPSPFNNRPLSRSSSLGTPAPSPGGHWQGVRPQIPDYSRPHSRSSNATTPGPDASPSQMPQWNPGAPNSGLYSARNPGTVRGFAPNLSPGPASPFSPTRLSQSSTSSRLPMNLQGPRGEVPHHGFPMNQSASQQLRFHSQNVQQRTQQSKSGQPLPYQTTQPRFGASAQLRGLVPPMSDDQNAVGMQGNMFRPCPPYRPARIQFARINETDSGGNQPRFPFRHSQPQIRNMHYQGQVVQQRFPYDHQQYSQFHGPLPTLRPSQYVPPGMMNPGLAKPMGKSDQPAPTKPKRTRRRKTKQPVVKKNNQQQALNTNFMTAEFPDLFGPEQIQHDISDKITNPVVCSNDYPMKNLHSANLTKESGQLPVATRTVTTPNLIMPSGMPGSQSSQAGHTIEKPSALKPPMGENLSMVDSQTALQTPAGSLNIQKDPGREVTTPPLPVLSPTCLFEEGHKGDDDDDFSNFASPSPAVFDFPISVASSVSDSKSTVVSSLSDSVKVAFSSSASVSTANAIPTPILSTMIKQPVSLSVGIDHKSTSVKKVLDTSQDGNHASTPTRSHFVQYNLQKSHSISRDSTSLVSSSGKIFQVPKKPSTSSTRRRHSDQGPGHSIVPVLDLSIRRRLRSDPCPSKTVYFSKSDSIFNTAVSVKKSKRDRRSQQMVKQPSQIQSIPSSLSKQLPSLVTDADPPTKESKAKSLDTSSDLLSSTEARNEPAEAVITDSSTVSAEIRLHSPVDNSLLREETNSKDNIIPPFTTASMSPVSLCDTKMAQSSSSLSEHAGTQISTQPTVVVTAQSAPGYANAHFNVLKMTSETSSSNPNAELPTDKGEPTSCGQIVTETNELASSGPNTDEPAVDRILGSPSLDSAGVMRENVEMVISDEIENEVENESDATFLKDSEKEKVQEESGPTNLTIPSISTELSQEGETDHKPTQLEQERRSDDVDDVKELNDVHEPEESAISIATEREASGILDCKDELCADSQATVLLKDVEKPCSPKQAKLEQLENTEMELDAASQKSCQNHPQSASDSILKHCTLESNEKGTRTADEVLSSSLKCQLEEVDSNAIVPFREAADSKKINLNVKELETPLHPSDNNGHEVTAKPDNITSCVTELPLYDDVKIVSPSASLDSDGDASNAVIIQSATIPERTLVYDEDSDTSDVAEKPVAQEAKNDIPDNDAQSTKLIPVCIAEEGGEETASSRKGLDSVDEVESSLAQSSEPSDFLGCQNVDTHKGIAMSTIPTSDVNVETLTETQDSKTEKTEEPGEIEGCSSLADTIKKISDSPSVKDFDAELTTTVTASSLEVLSESTSKLKHETLNAGQVVAEVVSKKFETKLETELPGNAVDQSHSQEEDPTVSRPISSNSSQMHFSLPSGLAISHDLTHTVIRQLSNYNTILKNLLVSGVIDPTTIAQLTSAASAGQDETQNNVVSALINNAMQLFKEENSDVPQLVSSSKHQHPHPADGEGAPSTSRFPQVIPEIKENPSIQITSASPASQQNVELKSNPACGDLAIIAASQAASHSASPNHGLQVPIVSSSVKGSIHSEEEDSELKAEAPTGARTGQQKTVQNEVSTSIKGSESVQKQTPPEAIIIAKGTIPEKRRTRTRNATSKQYTKRFERADPSEKLTKRSSGSASSSSNSRAPQRSSGSSEKQNKNVKSGDLVWGQMRGFPSWPGKVVKPSEVRGLQQRAPLCEGKVWVKWFGDHTFTQMNPADLVSMTEGLEAHHRSRKKGRTRTRKISAHLETAIQEAVDELEQQQGSIKKPQVSLIPVIPPIVAQPTTVEVPEKPRRGRKRKAT